VNDGEDVRSIVGTSLVIPPEGSTVSLTRRHVDFTGEEIDQEDESEGVFVVEGIRYEYSQTTMEEEDSERVVPITVVSIELTED
jgi:hypothetical protein